MEKIKFNLIDNIFSHDKYSVAGRDSEFINWDRSCSNKFLPTFFSHDCMFRNTNEFSESYGLIFESKSIIPNFYNSIKSHLGKFNNVFTTNYELINKYNNCLWIPGGGVWIGGSYGKGEVKIFDKTKICSLVSSQKKMCELHNFRLNIVNNINRNLVDVYGIDKWVPINETLEKYMFSIVIENYQDELYFTEKILNCFATGTIPIYYGATKIQEKFDSNGIITFSNEKELSDILNNLNYDLYLKKIESVKVNFERCKNYLSIEDYIFINYFKN
jgi:hypothetical protein